MEQRAVLDRALQRGAEPKLDLDRDAVRALEAW
jgi:hypothetical protein